MVPVLRQRQPTHAKLAEALPDRRMRLLLERTFTLPS